MSTGATHTNTATFASGRIMRAAPAVRAPSVVDAHRSTPIRLDGRSPDAIADAEAPTPYDPPARCARARIAAAPSSLPRLIDWCLPLLKKAPAIVRRRAGSSSTGTLPPASIHVAGNTRPETASPPLPPAISPATPTPAIPDPRCSSCRRPFVVTRRHLYQATLAQGRVRKIERLHLWGKDFSFLETMSKNLLFF